MKAVIIEDETLTAKRLASLIHQYDKNITIIAYLSSVAESIEWFQKNVSPDIVFMDIHLEDDLAFRIFDNVQLQAPVIFTTAYDEYMVKAFKVNSIDYLLKPVNYDELVQALEKYKRLKQQTSGTNIETLLQFIHHKQSNTYKERFMVNVGNKLKSIEENDIANYYTEARLSLAVMTDNQSFPVDFSLDKLQEVLNPKEYFRVSRQVIVSFYAIQAAHIFFKGKLKLDIVPKPKFDVLVSADRAADFKEWMGR